MLCDKEMTHRLDPWRKPATASTQYSSSPGATVVELTWIATDHNLTTHSFLRRIIIIITPTEHDGAGQATLHHQVD